MRLVMIALLAVAVALPAAARAPSMTPLPRPKPVDATALIAASGLGAEVGYLMIDARDGRVLAARAPDTPAMPASVIKTATSLYALERLGPDHRFETRVRQSERDLILEGGGDPTLDTAELARLAEEAARKARPPVERFLYDESALPRAAVLAAGQPVHAAYNPSIGGLNLNFNRVLMRWRRSDGKQKVETVAFAQKRTAPASTIALTRTAAGQKPLSHAFVDGRERWTVDRALFGAGPGSRWLPVRDAGRYTATVFLDLARPEGLTLPAPEPGAAPPQAPVIARHRSAPLSTMLRGMMRYSNNLTAEALGIVAGGTGSPDAMAAWMQGLDPSVDWSGLRVPNHSGLSAAARATPRQMTALIRAGLARQGEAFLTLLPRNPVADPGFGGAVSLRAKTGTINYGRGLAGVMQKGGQRAIFALFIGDMARRAAFDATLDPHALVDPPEARAWIRRAKRLEGAILRMLAGAIRP